MQWYCLMKQLHNTIILCFENLLIQQLIVVQVKNTTVVILLRFSIIVLNYLTILAKYTDSFLYDITK